MANLEGFRLGDSPLSSWTTCPVFRSPLVEAVADVKACTICFRAYTEAGIAPIAYDRSGSGVILTTEPYQPLTLAGLPRAQYLKPIWMLRPPGYSSDLPPMLPDEEFEIRAFTSWLETHQHIED
jgi:hypothetical protein